jgi:hypothetical protein
MGSPSTKKSNTPRRSREKLRAHRLRLRAMGLRPVQIWVPDTRSKRFAAAAHRQSAEVARSEVSSEDQAFIDALSDPWPV